MKKHSFKEWLVVTRYWSFAVSSAPVLVTFAYLCSRHLLPGGAMPVVTFVLALIGVVILHAAGNVLSDYFDYKSGVDNEKAFAVPNLVYHKFEPKEYLVFSVILFAVGIAIGLLLTLLTGFTLLIIGGIGVVLTACYAFFKYHALGDLDIFIIFSVLIMLGTSFVVTGSVVWDALVLALPVGIITVSVLHANNTLDINSDREAGIKTFAMLLGGHTSSVLYRIYMVIPFLAVVGAVIFGYLHPLSLLCLVAALPAWGNFKAASHFEEKGLETMAGLDQGSAKLQTVFSGTLAIGLFIAALL